MSNLYVNGIFALAGIQAWLSPLSYICDEFRAKIFCCVISDFEGLELLRKLVNLAEISGKETRSSITLNKKTKK